MSINSVPPCVLKEIFLYAGFESLPACSSVCKKWNGIIKNNKYFLLDPINIEYINFFNFNKIFILKKFKQEVFDDFNKETMLLNGDMSKKRKFLSIEANQNFCSQKMELANLTKACLNTLYFSKEKVEKKIDQFFENFSFQKRGVESITNLCFLKNRSTLISIFTKTEENNFTCTLKIIDGEVAENDMNWFYFKSISESESCSMATSNSKNFILEVENYTPDSRSVLTQDTRTDNPGFYAPIINGLEWRASLKNLLFKNMVRIESKWLKVDQKKITIYNITVHQKTEIGERVYIAGAEGRVLDIHTLASSLLEWKNYERLTLQEDDKWSCKVQRYSEEPVQFKIIIYKHVQFEEFKTKWEIIDNNPLKSRTINVGDSTEIYLDNLTFQE